MNLLLLDIPEEIETDRLLLRAVQPGDGQAMNEAIVESLDELSPWLIFAQKAPTIEESEENVRNSYANFLRRKRINYLIWPKEQPTVVAGRLGLIGGEPDVPSYEIGYWMRTSHGRRGFMTEAVSALTDLAFDVLAARRVFIRCDANNERSAAVPKRLGYNLEGRLLCDSRDHFGKLRDTLVFAKVRPE